MKRFMKWMSVLMVMVVFAAQSAFAGEAAQDDMKSIGLKLHDLVSHYDPAEAEQNQALQEDIEEMQEHPAADSAQLQGQLSQDGQEWTCEVCGATMNGGRFCSECGSPRPGSAEWECPECGQINSGMFCSNCGTAKPGTQSPEPEPESGDQTALTISYDPSQGTDEADDDEPLTTASQESGQTQGNGGADLYSDIEFTGTYNWDDEYLEWAEEIGMNMEYVVFMDSGYAGYIPDFMTEVTESEDDGFTYINRYTTPDGTMTVGFLAFNSDGYTLPEFAEQLTDLGFEDDGWCKYNGTPVYRAYATSDKLSAFSFMESSYPEAFFAVQIDYDVMSDDFDSEFCGTLSKLIYNSIMWVED